MNKKKYVPTKTGKSVYEIITERILVNLEAGVVPWHKPWQGGADRGQRNLITKRPYRGVNVWLTLCAGYQDERWITWKQLKEIGGQVNKGEHATPIVYWLIRDSKTKKNSKGEPEKIFSCMYYRVFNVEQCRIDPQWLVEEEKPQLVEPIDSAQAIINGYENGPSIEFGHGRAWYQRVSDTVGMPHARQFEGPEHYYSTLFHELTHSTGHHDRLNREGFEGIHHFGDPSYCKEELVAEMGASFLCAHAGIENKTIENSAAYLKSWIDALKGDSKLLIHASAAAQKACDLILGKKEEA